MHIEPDYASNLLTSLCQLLVLVLLSDSLAEGDQGVLDEVEEHPAQERRPQQPHKQKQPQIRTAVRISDAEPIIIIIIIITISILLIINILNILVKVVAGVVARIVARWVAMFVGLGLHFLECLTILESSLVTAADLSSGAGGRGGDSQTEHHETGDEFTEHFHLRYLNLAICHTLCSSQQLCLLTTIR